MGEQRDLQLLVQKGFGLVENAGVPEGDYGNTPHTFLQACRSIGEQEPHSRQA